MFNKFFNTETEENKDESQPNQQDRITAAITYYYDPIDKDIKIDVAVKDYSEESINDLCNILNVLSNDKAYIQTVTIIRTSLAENENKDSLTKFLVNIGKQTNKTFMSKLEEVVMNQPCVRPSDML
jgi:Ser-tRNA(Ala) deacylase AlaX